MGAYLIRRLGWLVATFTFIIVLVFVMVKATGIDPCVRTGKETPAFIAACHERYGYDKPVIIQLGRYLERVAHLDFGESAQHEGMTTVAVLAEGFPYTVVIVSLALALAVFLGIAFGVIAAVRRNTPTDYLCSGLAMVGIAVPELVIGPLLIIGIIMQIDGWPRTDLHDARTYIFPILTLALPMTAAIARLARSGMLDVLHQDFIRTARAKGVPERQVIIRHALRVGITPVITLLGPLTAGAYAGGSFVVEKLFSIPGMGGKFIEAATGEPIDVNMIMLTTMCIATLILVANTFVDLVYAALNPRIRDAVASDATTTRGAWWQTLTTLACIALAVAVTMAITRGAAAIDALNSAAITRFTDQFPHLGLIAAGAWAVVGAVTIRASLRAFAAPSGTSAFGDAWRRLAQHRGAVVSAEILFVIVFACLLVPWVLKMQFGIVYDRGIIAESSLAPPFAAWFGYHDSMGRALMWRHLLGTDEIGRDVLARVLVGGCTSLTVGITALAISATIGTMYGTIAAYAGGRVDQVLMRFVDLCYSVPYIILVILFVAFLGKSVLLLFVAIGCVSWLTLARITRGEVLKIMQREHVVAARAMGASWWRIVARHCIPNAIGPITTYAMRLIAVLILEEAFLSFLGVGIQDPMASWGNIIQAWGKAQGYWWYLSACAVLTVTLCCLNFLGDGLRDAFDVQLKGAE
ncbi:MAG: ABC transporter permease subunit [bacterium]|nr:ABC transporter permease subunit [bacterium]